MIVPLIVSLLATAGILPGSGLPAPAAVPPAGADSLGSLPSLPSVGGDLFSGFS